MCLIQHLSGLPISIQHLSGSIRQPCGLYDTSVAFLFLYFNTRPLLHFHVNLRALLGQMLHIFIWDNLTWSVLQWWIAITANWRKETSVKESSTDCIFQKNNKNIIWDLLWTRLNNRGLYSVQSPVIECSLPPPPYYVHQWAHWSCRRGVVIAHCGHSYFRFPQELLNIVVNFWTPVKQRGLSPHTHVSDFHIGWPLESVSTLYLTSG